MLYFKRKFYKRVALKRLLFAMGMGLCANALADEPQFNPTAQFDVPEIGSGVGIIDQQKEKIIGEQVYRQIQRQMPVVHNAWLEDQLFSVFSQILSQTQLQKPIGLLVIKDNQINAFAVPGGVFALNSGLITSARSMDEVVGVMSHEIAHVTQRHFSRSQEAFKGQGLLALAGIVIGAIVASQSDGNAGAALMLGTQAALLDKQLNYSRNQEREADRIGMQYMYAAGYNPEGMADFFELMHRSSSQVSFFPDFWLTHPLTTERMSEARLRANQLPKVKSRANKEDFEILKQYTAVLSNQANETQLKTLASRGSFAGQIALAAWYQQTGDYVAAQKAINDAKAQNKNHNLLLLIQADIYLSQNKFTEAKAAIESTATIIPENRALNLKLAEILVRQGNISQAQNILQRFVKKDPRDVTAWSLMQQAANLDKENPMRTVNVLRYRAEVQYWSGYDEDAIKSLLHAERLAKDNSSMSETVKKRLSDMQKERQFKI